MSTDPTVPNATWPPAAPEPSTVPTPPVAPAPPVPPAPPAPPPAEPQPEKWAGRAGVPGAAAPGQKRPAPPTTPTQYMAPYTEPGATTVAPRVAPSPRPGPRKRSATSRFFLAVFALVLLLAVPVVSAYVAYKLASGGNPFEWPPTVDYDQIFGR